MPIEPELASETTNISRSGLFMRSPQPLQVGAALSMTLSALWLGAGRANCAQFLVFGL
jgi:hypothetical protein